MFTGLISEIGKVDRLARAGTSGRLTVIAPRTAGHLRPGDSVATAGACLTVETVSGERYTSSVITETFAATRLGTLRRGDKVNLELPVGPQGVFGGHLVSGHVDTVGWVRKIHRVADAGKITVAYPPAFDNWVVDKGSIALDGVSLTIAEVGRGEITVGVIPTTWAETTLGLLKVGDEINIEFDQAIKVVAKARTTMMKNSGLTEEGLLRAGW